MSPDDYFSTEALEAKGALEGDAGVYPAYQIKAKRHRATKAEMADRKAGLLEILRAQKPMTVRQVFYQATVRGLVEKSESGYDKVQSDLVMMRQDGTVPWGWVVDHTRMQRKPRTFNSMTEAMEEAARLYRKNLWRNTPCYVEIWLEKDALAGVIFPVTEEYDVKLMSARGYASLSFLSEAGEYIAGLDVPAYIYHFGDRDPSGVNAGENIEQRLRQFAPNAAIHFERVAVTRAQIAEYNLPSRPTKASDSRAAKFEGDSVELDAIPPTILRDLVRESIERHLPKHELDILKVAEESERSFLRKWTDVAATLAEKDLAEARAEAEEGDAEASEGEGE
jgi:hypothetical protein